MPFQKCREDLHDTGRKTPGELPDRKSKGHLRCGAGRIRRTPGRILCVGHDSLVFKYSEAPCTVLAAKDRVFGHNPLAAVYTLDSYYRYLKEPME
jgi:hypothetical protein